MDKSSSDKNKESDAMIGQAVRVVNALNGHLEDVIVTDSYLQPCAEYRVQFPSENNTSWKEEIADMFVCLFRSTDATYIGEQVFIDTANVANKNYLNYVTAERKKLITDMYSLMLLSLKIECSEQEDSAYLHEESEVETIMEEQEKVWTAAENKKRMLEKEKLTKQIKTNQTNEEQANKKQVYTKKTQQRV